MTEHGFHDATTDLDQVEAWWRQSPGANIGVPTGAASGAVVVDVDVHGPVDGRAGFDRASRAGMVDGWELLVRTPTGGLHAYYPTTPGTEQRSWQAGRAGIDFRGDGGYIIVPPSLRSIQGATAWYRVEQVNTGPTGLLDSDALRDFLDPRPAPRPRPETWQPVGREDAQRLAAWLNRQDTDRNLKLFWASCRLAEGGVPLTDALDTVLTAAKSETETDARADANRRLCNQAFSTKIYIEEDDELRVENNRPFEMLLKPEINANALNWAQNADKARTPANDSIGKGSSLVRGVGVRGLEPLTSRV